MQISKIEIRNILGIDNLEFKAGKINIISGKNGVGKTSIIEAIKATLNGKVANATLLKQGAEKGESVLLLTDSTEIKRTVSDDSKLEVKNPDGKIGKPQTFVDSLVKWESVNPMNFLTAEKKKQASILLQATPMKVSESELKEAVQGIIDIPKGLSSKHALEAIEIVHKQVYEERTIQNRFAKEKGNTVLQMSQTLPQDVDPNINIELQLETFEETKTRMEVKRNQYFAEFEKERNELKEQANQENEAMIEAARKVFEAKIEEARFIRDKKYKEYENLCNQKKEEKQKAFEEKYNPLLENIGKLREAIKNMATVNETKRIIDNFKQDVESHKTKSEQLTQALSNLETLKGNLLQNLPIKGLEVIDGEIYLDKIPFERLNTAKQIKISIEIAKLLAGELNVICIDGFERLDEEATQEFIRQAEESDYQFFITKVTNDNLNIQVN